MKNMTIVVDGVTYDLVANSTWSKVNVLDADGQLVVVTPVDSRWSDQRVRDEASVADKRVKTFPQYLNLINLFQNCENLVKL